MSIQYIYIYILIERVDHPHRDWPSLHSTTRTRFVFVRVKYCPAFIHCDWLMHLVRVGHAIADSYPWILTPGTHLSRDHYTQMRNPSGRDPYRSRAAQVAQAVGPPQTTLPEQWGRSWDHLGGGGEMKIMKMISHLAGTEGARRKRIQRPNYRYGG